MKRVVALTVLLSSVVSCSSKRPETLTVFAASSLTTTFTKLGADFEARHPGTKVVFSFGASSALAQQVLAAAPADVFASASTSNIHQVDADVTAVATFARNAAEIAVRPGVRVSGLADLARPGLKVVLCDSSVPCGALADKVLASAHVRVRPVSRGLDVKTTLGYVTSGAADAAIVYVTDVLAAGRKVTGVPIAVNATTAYEIAMVKASRHRALAREFEDFVLSADGQGVLAAAGFQKP
jgi:molybdate transport system substrate-binding protein